MCITCLLYTSIADNAFDGCDKLTIYGIKGSYAEPVSYTHLDVYKRQV